MTKQSNKIAYPNDNNISDNDYLGGTDGDTNKKFTKSYQISDLRDYILQGLNPELGGTLKINEINYEGILTTPEEVVNQLVPDYEVLAYHAVFISVNGQQFLLKLQDRLIGADQEAVTSDDFIEFPISVGPTGPAGSQGEQGEKGMNWRGAWEAVLYSPDDVVSYLGTSYICIISTSTAEDEVPLGNTRWEVLAERGTNGANGTNGADGISVVASGVTTTVSGAGSIGNPYVVEVENLQKDINEFPYEILPGDNKHTLFVNNGSTNITINIPNTGIPDNFECVLIQKGTGTVTIINDVGVTLLYPPALTPVIKGRYYWVVLERDTTTQDYYLCGTLVPV